MRKGFSLLEVVFSTSFLFMVMLALCTLIPSAARMVAKSRYLLIADSLARRTLEDYRARDFDTVAPGPGLAAVETREGVTFTPTVKVTKLPGVGDFDFSKRVSVKIQWSVRGIDQVLEKEAWLANIPRE